MRHATCGLPVSCWMLLTAAAARSGLRPTSTTVAPWWAKACAVTKPMPEVAPVTRQILPCMGAPSPLLQSENHHPHRSVAQGIDIQGLQQARVLVNAVGGEAPRFQACRIEKRAGRIEAKGARHRFTGHLPQGGQMTRGGIDSEARNAIVSTVGRI